MRLTRRLYWALRRPRGVRLHLVNDRGTVLDPSVSGVLMGVWGGHYVLASPKLLETPERTHTLDGIVEVPVHRVLFVQVTDL